MVIAIELASDKIATVPLSKDSYLLVEPDTASWAIVDKEVYNVISSGRLETLPKKMLYMLYSAGLISIEGETAISPHSFSKYQKPDPVLGVIKASTRCNLKCKYCYAYRGEDVGDIMDLETARKCVDFMMRSKEKRIRIVLHGGEPLYVGKNWLFEFLKYVSKVEKKFAKKVEVGIQTNGTLISKELATLLAKYKVGVGVSIDGPPEINDEVRPFNDGSPSTQIVTKAIKLLISLGVEVGVIAVITKLNFNRMGEVLSFFQSLGISDIKLLPCSAVMGRSRYHPEIHISPKEYFMAMKSAIEFCLNNDSKLVIKPISYLVENIISWERRFMCSRSPCGAANNILTFDINGDIYPCDEIVGFKEYVIGNVWSNTMKEVLYHPTSIDFRNRIVSKIEKCSKCIWRNFCGGGCATRALLKTGRLLAEDEFCEYYKLIIPYLIKLIYNKKEFALKKLLPYFELEFKDFPINKSNLHTT